MLKCNFSNIPALGSDWQIRTLPDFVYLAFALYLNQTDTGKSKSKIKSKIKI
ncbi:hypothetical protein QUF72_08720 [Desulfobacterales bacterium HSG2]|nr:hypothetical protein [Desulfobacterales bacterium HSG2]